MPNKRSKSRKQKKAKSNKNDLKKLTEQAVLFGIAKKSRKTKLVFLKEGKGIEQKESYRNADIDIERKGYNKESELAEIRNLYKIEIEESKARPDLEEYCKSILSSKVSVNYPELYTTPRELFLIQWVAIFLKYVTDSRIHKNKIYSSMSSMANQSEAVSIYTHIVNILNNYPILFSLDPSQIDVKMLKSYLTNLYNTDIVLIVLADDGATEINFYELYNNKDKYYIVDDPDVLENFNKNMKLANTVRKIEEIKDTRFAVNLTPSRDRHVFAEISQLNEEEFKQYMSTLPKPSAHDLFDILPILSAWVEYEIAYAESMLEELSTNNNYFSDKYSREELNRMIEEAKHDFDFFEIAFENISGDWQYARDSISIFGGDVATCPSNSFFTLVSYVPDLFQEFDDIVSKGNSPLLKDKLKGMDIDFATTRFKRELRVILDKLVISFSIYNATRVSERSRLSDDPNASAPSVNVEQQENIDLLNPNNNNENIPNSPAPSSIFGSVQQELTEEESKRAMEEFHLAFPEEHEEVGIPIPPPVPSPTQSPTIPAASLGHEDIVKQMSRLKKATSGEPRREPEERSAPSFTIKELLEAKTLLKSARIHKVSSSLPIPLYFGMNNTISGFELEYPNRDQIDRKTFRTLIDEYIRKTIHPDYKLTEHDYSDLELMYYIITNIFENVSIVKEAYRQLMNDVFEEGGEITKSDIIDAVKTTLNGRGLFAINPRARLDEIAYVADLLGKMVKEKKEEGKYPTGSGFSRHYKRKQKYVGGHLPHINMQPYRGVSYRYN